jgi:hypothetical protein
VSGAELLILLFVFALLLGAERARDREALVGNNPAAKNARECATRLMCPAPPTLSITQFMVGGWETRHGVLAAFEGRGQ